MYSKGTKYKAILSLFLEQYILGIYYLNFKKIQFSDLISSLHNLYIYLFFPYGLGIYNCNHRQFILCSSHPTRTSKDRNIIGPFLTSVLSFSRKFFRIFYFTTNPFQTVLNQFYRHTILFWSIER